MLAHCYEKGAILRKRPRKQTVTQCIMQQVYNELQERSHDLSRAQYARDCRRFIKYCRDTFDCRSFEDCKTYVQEYSDHLQAESYSASTIHTYLAAVCVVFEVDLRTINKPTRHVAEYTRGRMPKRDGVSSDLSDPKWKYLVDFQRAVGIRREELMHLHGNDFCLDESGYPCVFVRRGKGGKPQLQRILDKHISLVQSYYDAVPSNTLVFDRGLFKNDLNFHSLRAESAKEYYQEQLRLISVYPEYADRLEQEIRARWAMCNKDKQGRPRPFFERELRGYYTLRGKNRALAIQKNLPLRYNKLALLATSIFKLSHWRNDVTIASYLLA